VMAVLAKALTDGLAHKAANTSDENFTHKSAFLNTEIILLAWMARE
jgi:hypothetical protein